MEPHRIVKGRNVVEDVQPGFKPRTVVLVVHPLAFQCAEEAFHYSVVVAAALAAHTHLNPIGR
jgi:hypothetical protein